MTRHHLRGLPMVLLLVGIVVLLVTTLLQGSTDSWSPPAELARGLSTDALDTVEGAPPPVDRPPVGTPASGYLEAVDRALRIGNVSAAEAAWHDAHGAALRGGRWEDLIAVGDAYLRIGEAAHQRTMALPRARQAYLAGLFRARRDGTVTGALRAAEAFAALGDREVAEQSLHVAAALALGSRRPRDEVSVHALRDRWTGRSTRVKAPLSTDPLPLLPRGEGAGR